MNVDALYHQIYELKEQLSFLRTEYWYQTSGVDTWYFWFNIASYIVPLVILYLFIDRRRVFEIGFFGYSIHMLWGYTNNFLSINNLLVHPHSFSFLIPVGLSVTAVILPVGFMFIYQYCTNYKKNYYFYAILLSVLFAYGFGAFSIAVNLLELHKWMTLTYVFLIDVMVAFLAYWLTKFFIWIGRQSTKQQAKD
ncbi:hypothetical protein [Virgibacillus salexigens]|uniref:Uncharacterized protein n=1 Tax=Virgibacillus kapii TaxID=1638645 RepID=A0ABQ2DNL2_9BACI|nr:hypothetical protein [Virgibacillus kapii]GGJ65437.1 hypothetical protein GCM10007111_29090 [Virgibacillus kapii]